ncbi:G protein-regulated inducer of neurite outgrowth 3 [Alligator sinensis]|uniref:G protein-regulated inducer of neurite outgrowth 3 n=1 Tax=Alligator sinensis TaxID=38654 RepID=A0A1U8CUD0_ALLSI|nr:G protein-regulated inducer of neurite outgrowth 3 [Alligator sinensis]
MKRIYTVGQSEDQPNSCKYSISLLLLLEKKHFIMHLCTGNAAKDLIVNSKEKLFLTAFPVVQTAPQEHCWRKLTASFRSKKFHGTVPDPLRSAKVSLISASEEEDHLGDLQSTKHQHKQPSVERSSNGISHTMSESVGVCLFDLKDMTAANVQRQEQFCENVASQQDIRFSGSLSQNQEVYPVCTKTASTSEQKDNSTPIRHMQIVTKEYTVGHVPDTMPATQNSKLMHSDQPKTSSLTQVDDSAVKTCGSEDQSDQWVRGSVGELNSSSPSNTIKNSHSCHHSSPTNILQRVPMEKEKGLEVIDSGFPQETALVKDFATGLSKGPQASLEAEKRAATDVKSCATGNTALDQSDETSSQFRLAAMEPACNADTEKTRVHKQQLSRFRDIGTMTVQPESSSLAEEASKRMWRDAEVQAVASVESKSASTSPSILAAFLMGNLPAEEKENLHFIYQGCGELTHSEDVESFSSLKMSPCCPGVMPELHVPPAAVETVKAQTVKLQKHPGDPSDTICPALPDNTKAYPCAQAASNTHRTPVDRPGQQGVCPVRDSCDIPQLLSDAPVSQKAKPVYQIAINTNNQPAVHQQSRDREPIPFPSAIAPKVNRNFQHIVSDAGNKQSPISCRTHRESGQGETWGTKAGGCPDRKSLQGKSGDELKTSPFKMDMKPKEEKLMLLDPKGEMHISAAAACGHIRVYTPVTVKKEQDKVQGEITRAKKVSSLSLQIGLTSDLSGYSAHCTSGLGAHAAPQQQISPANDTRNEPKLNATPDLASAQPLLKLGEKKKQSTPSMEPKVRVKQSKHIRDVVWDEQGMTWEVYGASLDPESLGIAIQNHLQRQIREHEKLIRAQNTQNRKSISSDTSSNKKLKGRQHNMFQAMLQNFRHPNCCVHPAPSSVLD